MASERLGSVVRVDFGRSDELPISKRQLASLFGYSRRWVELRVREGMPSTMEGSRRMFRVSECRAWLESVGRAEPSSLSQPATVRRGSPAATRTRRRRTESTPVDDRSADNSGPTVRGEDDPARRIAALEREVAERAKTIIELRERIAQLEDPLGAA